MSSRYALSWRMYTVKVMCMGLNLSVLEEAFYGRIFR
jgi:hypothetical protein